MTPTFDTPVPFQSPTTGMSPGKPNWKAISPPDVPSQTPLLFSSRNQVQTPAPRAGQRNTPSLMTPLPSQSPATGMSPARPNCLTLSDGLNTKVPELLSRSEEHTSE